MSNEIADNPDRLIEFSQSVVIEAGTLEFSEEDMTATGRLIPFGVKARSNLGEFTFSQGDVSIPADLSGMSLNVEHKREDVVGAFSNAWEQEDGVFASFRFSDTEEGRAAFADAKSGKRKNLSAEVAKVRIKDGKALPGARLFAGALVERPAFEGATLLAAEDTPDAESQPDEYAAWLARIEAAIADIRAAVRNEIDPAAAPAEDTETDTTTEEFSMSDTNEAGAQVPATLLASAPVVKNTDVDLHTVFASMAAVKSGTSAQTADAETLLATISDIKAEASGGLTTAGSGIIQPAWVGKLWQGKRYQQRYIDLANHQFGGISLGGRKGFKLSQGTALVARVSNAGQKVELPSGTASTSVFGSSLRKYGYAADIAREWFDLEGGTEVITAFWEGVVESYAQIVDTDAMTDIFTCASKTSTALDRLIAPATYPTQYTAAMGQLIQGIEAVSDAGDTPSFAVVNPYAWNQLLFTPKDLVPEFVEFAVGIGTGEASTGKVRVVKAADSFFSGLSASKPQVIVGAKNAIEFREQGSTPIQIDALEVAKYGVDRALVGFMETFVVRPESLALIGAV